MARFRQEETVLFERKVIENYRAGVLLFNEKHYNAAATRIYYAFILLGIRNAAMYGDIPEYLYCKERSTQVDKSKIKNNIRGLRIINPAYFRICLVQAESARVKADYLSESVLPEEIDGLLPKLKKLSIENGVTI
jgi:hypothetical protein